eukprot:CAMPEP_0169332704 /NCGR_PEP_ID=MMETSP1017-20121227/14865_1 /TAXON_ID=342587 /ORGANISM="Karlodinium micrum, Strain CCMP2283" /LENGTH=821 /DNA_ID=CAMNT_0009427871 /DNA_START=58 /DNA_END=2524 /DNA_ORIENTATION=+
MADVEVDLDEEEEPEEADDDLVEIKMTPATGTTTNGDKADVDVKAMETEPSEPKAPSKPAEPEEVEKDEPAAAGKLERLVEEVSISAADTTLDVFFDASRGILSSLSEGGFRYLVSGARANTGVISGRYLFEVQVLGSVAEAAVKLRIGLSTAKSSLFLGEEDSECCCFFDRDGGFFSDGKKKPAGLKMGKAVVGILLNLDKDSPNANTVSMFLDGVRSGKAQALPSSLIGKPLYPNTDFMNVTLAVNFGRAGRQLKALPFKCNMLADISKDKGEQKGFKAAADGSFQVVVPVGLPEKGVFDFVDRFCEEHPEFEEMSRRKLLKWCRISGVEPQAGATDASRDAPDFSFGLDGLDDKTMMPMLETLAQLARKDVIVGEVCSSLLRTGRSSTLSKFPSTAKTTAIVVIGEPAAPFKQWVHAKIKAGNDKAVVDDSVWFLPAGTLCDVSDKVVSQNYAKFSLPVEDEGFGKIDFQWLAREPAEAYLKQWVLEKKATTLIEDLVPGEWFTTKLKAWHTLRSEVQKIHMEFSKKRKETPEVDAAANFDIKGVTIEDIHNVDAKGTPIYANFKYEDWILLAWRYELHLLVHAFAADANDSDRPGIPEDHLPNYYKIYYKTKLDPSKLGCDNLQKVFKILKLPALQLVDKGGKSKILSSELDKETSLKDFIVDVETYRRNRLRRIDAGDESAQLKFPKNTPAKGGGKGKADAPKAPNAPTVASAPGVGKAATPPKTPAPKAVVANPAAAAAAGAGAVKRPMPPNAPPPGGAPKRPRVDGETGSAPPAKPAVAKAPVGKTPVAKAPVGKTPVSKAPIGKAPIAKRPSA